MGNFAKFIGYFLSIGAVLGLIGYGIYSLIPEIAPYLTNPAFLIVIIGIFGVLLIILGLIIERVKDKRRENLEE